MQQQRRVLAHVHVHGLAACNSSVHACAERRGDGSQPQAFHVVAPSLPGYGFSSAPKKPGFGIRQMAATMDELMQRLGYDRYVAQGERSCCLSFSLGCTLAACSSGIDMLPGMHHQALCCIAVKGLCCLHACPDTSLQDGSLPRMLRCFHACQKTLLQGGSLAGVHDS
jgi:hypothetical protein